MADDETLPGDADATGPWTIKSVPAKLRRDIIAEARKEGATVAVWLERRMVEWQTIVGVGQSAQGAETGRPAPLLLTGPAPTPADHAEFVRLALAMAALPEVSERDRTLTLRAASVRVRKALRRG